MADYEKLKRAVEMCITGYPCNDCPYLSNRNCSLQMVSDALELLKEHEAEVEIEGGGSTWFYVCGECHTSVSPYAKYCRECGRRLIWENITLK